MVVRPPPTIPRDARRAAVAALAWAVSHAVHAERTRLTPRIAALQLELREARKANARLWAIIGVLVGIRPAGPRRAARRRRGADER